MTAYPKYRCCYEKFKPAYTKIECPYCHNTANISRKDGGAFWLADSQWQCPFCKNFVNRKDLIEH